ncbi:MAG: DUF4197 domain-containing protein [Novosphingobium sp.]|nr:DUF4197 domain-containing protein [Novosphingobium sp.]
MDNTHHSASRRVVLAGLGAAIAGIALADPARAQLLGGGLGGLLGKASDSALDKLAQPGAFYGNPAVRIGLPVLGSLSGLGGGLGGSLGGTLGSVLGTAEKQGLLDGLMRQLNDAAGVAAGAAKPMFRTAISKLSITDVPGIVRQNDGATQYLKRSAGDQLALKLRPMIDTALGQVGAFRTFDGLAKTSSLVRAAGLTRGALGKSVTDQALNGIFRYIGGEEGRLRANPLGPAGSLLDGLLKGH